MPLQLQKTSRGFSQDISRIWFVNLQVSGMKSDKFFM
jgi:hypothetical protein